MMWGLWACIHGPQRTPKGEAHGNRASNTELWLPRDLHRTIEVAAALRPAEKIAAEKIDCTVMLMSRNRALVCGFEMRSDFSENVNVA